MNTWIDKYIHEPIKILSKEEARERLTKLGILDENGEVVPEWKDLIIKKRNYHNQNANEIEPTFIDIVNARQRLCKKFQAFVNCAGCPIAAAKERYCENKHITCAEFMFNYSHTALTVIENYNKEHPINPTWQEWFNYLYTLYHKFSGNKSYKEWLNTEITEEEANKFNIPNKEQLTYDYAFSKEN